MKVRKLGWSMPVVAGALLAMGCAEEQLPTAPPENQAPTAVIAANLTEIVENDNNTTVITISGTSSTDPNGDALTYIWSIPGATYENGTNSSNGIIQVSFTGTSTELVNLVVRDPGGLSDAAQIVITLRPGPNQPPTAALTVSPPTIPFFDGNTTVVTLNGSDSHDIDGDDITFNWIVPGATFVGGTDATSEVAQVTLAGDAPVTVTLEVKDSKGVTDTATFTIQLTT